MSSTRGLSVGPKSTVSSQRTASGHLLRASAQKNIINNKLGQTTKPAPNPKDNKNTAIVTLDEFYRIKQQCSVGNQLEQEQRNRERMEL